MLLNQENGLVHCNFGWGGMCDGYYQFSIFNLSGGPLFTECGDSMCYSSAYYKKKIKLRGVL